MAIRVILQNTGPNVIVEEQKFRVVFAAKQGVPGLPGSPNAFAELTDTPGTYLGQAGKVPKVKDAEDGLEFGEFEVKEIDRTLNSTETPASNTGPLSAILNWFANRIKAITGKAYWYESPTQNLEQLNNTIELHKADYANPHKTPGKNLLHNWDFRNPVNQRGQSSYSVSGNTIDRWFIQENNTLSVNQGFVKLTATITTTQIRQYLEKAALFTGKQITLSFRIKAISASSVRLLVYDSATDGSSSGGTFRYVDHSFVAGEEKIVSFSCSLTSGISFVGLQPLTANVDFYLYCAKLELGSASTLANDPPADYGEQLALCQRYAIKLNGAFRASYYTANEIGFYVPVPVTPRTAGSIATNNFTVKNVAAGIQSGFTFTTAAAYQGCTKIVAAKTSHGLTDAMIECADSIVSFDL